MGFTASLSMLTQRKEKSFHINLFIIMKCKSLFSTSENPESVVPGFHVNVGRVYVRKQAGLAIFCSAFPIHEPKQHN